MTRVRVKRGTCLLILWVGVFISANIVLAAQDSGPTTGTSGTAAGLQGESSPQTLPGMAESLHPRIGIGLEEEYNDNVYLTSSGEEDDYITRANLSLVWGRRTPLWTASINYKPTYVYYSRHEDESELVHAATADGRMTLVRDLAYFEGRDTYSRVSLSSRRDRTTVSSFVDQTDQNVLVLHPYLRRNVSPTLLLEAGYEYTNTKYTDSGGTDRQSHGANALVSKAFSPRLSGSVLYRYLNQTTDSAEFSDFVRHESGLGFEYRVGEAFLLSGEGGVASVDFSGRSTDTGEFYRASLTYRRPAPFVWAYSYAQRFETSVEEGVYLSRHHEVSAAYERRLRGRIALFDGTEEYKEITRENHARGVRLVVEYPLVQNLVLGVRGEWRQGDYDPEDERVIDRSATASVSWQTSRYITLSGGYRFADSNSDMDNNDYESNVAFARIQSEF